MSVFEMDKEFYKHYNLCKEKLRALAKQFISDLFPMKFCIKLLTL